MAHISIREYIRWIPDEASEPTSTIVLTSPESRFVDVRLLLSTPGSESVDTSQILPISRLDWAIAGNSVYSPPSRDEHGVTFSHGKWEHWIDSRNVCADGVSDEGDNYSQPDGSTLEKGRMLNPATGVDTDYEEVWRSPQILATPCGPGLDGSMGKPAVRCVALRLHNDPKGERGLVMLLGQYCQGFLREGKDITVERWQWEEGAGQWTKQFQIGDGVLACSAAIQHAHELEKDTDIMLGLQAWTVVELLEQVDNQ